jgi:hypothetical protein
MKAIQYRAYGGYAENRFVDLPAPAAGGGLRPGCKTHQRASYIS